MTTAAPTINIASHLVVMAQRQPDAPALLSPLLRQADGVWRYHRCTYRQLDRKSDALARGLRTLGVVAGVRTALCLRPSVDFFAVTFALFKLGALPVLIDPGIGLRNFGRCLDEAGPTVFIGLPIAHLCRRLLGWARRTARLPITSGWFGGRSLADIERLGAAGEESVLVPSSPNDLAAILFTSGSTGPAKGVLYTHANFDAQVQVLRSHYHIAPGEIDLATFPLFGLFGPALGMTSVIPRMDFTRPGYVEPRCIIEPIRQLGITNMFGSPALLDRVAQWGAPRQLQLPSLRRVISAGAPVPASVIAQFSAMLAPGAEIFTPYGATESLPVASIGSREILTETGPMADRGLGVCVGRPVGHITVHVIRITDDPIPAWSDDLLLPPGQIGEIVVQGPVVTAAYDRRPDATRLAKIPDLRIPGRFFHRMGDVGYFDDRGRLWFCGRKSQRVRLPSGDLFSSPVEGLCNTHPLVRRAALVGVTHHGMMRPVVCLELRSTAPRNCRQQVRRDVLALLAADARTRQIQDILFHPRFPVDIRHNAKIGREKLALWAARKL